MRTVPIPPHRLLDYLIETYKLKNTRKLAQHLGVTQGYLSKLRHGVKKVSGDFILAIYDKTDMSIEEIRALLDDNGSDTRKEG